jgi:PIN domain nuclease of toxin-antitoxin system
MRPFLLDTCACLWIVADEISQKVADALTASRDTGLMTYVSPITAWEIGILSRKGRFRSSYAPQRWFEQLMSKPSVAIAPLLPEILMESSFLPGKMNDDPAGRIIAATAREYGYTVMTRDKALLDYGREGHLSVLEC